VVRGCARQVVICVLANAAQIAQVPGRKTNVKDCVWITQLREHGLIRESFDWTRIVARRAAGAQLLHREATEKTTRDAERTPRQSDPIRLVAGARNHRNRTV
jgi:hypothetical protein